MIMTDGRRASDGVLRLRNLAIAEMLGNRPLVWEEQRVSWGLLAAAPASWDGLRHLIIEFTLSRQSQRPAWMRSLPQSDIP